MLHPTPIAYFVLSPVTAGVENVVFQILKHLNRDQFKPVLIVSKEIAGHFDSLLPKNNLLVLDGLFYQPKNKYLKYVYPLLSRKFKWKQQRIKKHQAKVVSFLKQHHVKLIHSHLLEDHLLCSLIKPQLKDAKIVFTIHGTLALDPEDNYQTWLTSSETLSILKSADAYTSACQYFINTLAMYGISRNKFTLISNGVDLVTSDQFLAHHTDPIQNSLVFLGGGRVQQKGGDILIKSFHHLLHEEQVNDATLYIYGNVPENTKERLLVNQLGLENNVFFQGFVNPPNHLGSMLKHELFVLPSRHEGVANSLMEAIGLGMKIVATKVGGTEEVLLNYPHGITCEVNARDLAVQIKKQLNVENHLSLEYRKHFLWNNIAGDYELFYAHITT